MTESINAIKQIAAKFKCDPQYINNFKGSDIISFHARKCGLSKFEFEELITYNEGQ